MKKLFSRFKFNTRGRALNFLKIFPFFIFILGFLPILPYETKDGKLYSVLGNEASVNNFYALGIKALNENYVTKKGDPFYELIKLSEITFPSSQRDYLLKKGYEKELAGCIAIRDMIIFNYFVDSETSWLFQTYYPTPVPFIWILRMIFKEIYLNDSLFLPPWRWENTEKFMKKCSKYGDKFPPNGYINGNLNYEKETKEK